MKIYVSEELKKVYSEFVNELEKCEDSCDMVEKLYDYDEQGLFNETMVTYECNNQCERLTYDVRYEEDKDSKYFFLHFEDKEVATVLLKEVKF